MSRWLARDRFLAWLEINGLLCAHSPASDGHHHVRAPSGALLNGSLNLRRREVPPAAIAQIRRKARKAGLLVSNPWLEEGDL